MQQYSFFFVILCSLVGPCCEKSRHWWSEQRDASPSSVPVHALSLLPQPDHDSREQEFCGQHRRPEELPHPLQPYWVRRDTSEVHNSPSQNEVSWENYENKTRLLGILPTHLVNIFFIRDTRSIVLSCGKYRVFNNFCRKIIAIQATTSGESP